MDWRQDMPWPLMDLQVDVMVVDTCKTSGSRHALVVDVHWSLGSRCAMIVTQSILYSCRMSVLIDIYCFNHLSYIFFDTSFSHAQFILCESRTHLTAKQWIGCWNKWLSVIYLNTYQTRSTSYIFFTFP